MFSILRARAVLTGAMAVTVGVALMTSAAGCDVAPVPRLRPFDRLAGDVERVPGQQQQAGIHGEVEIAVHPDWKLSDELVLTGLRPSPSRHARG